jgi:hypothetical protein
VGTSTGWITTASGQNTVSFNWLSKTDIPLANGTYCLRLTANNATLDQATPATTTLVIDNVSPSAPGALSVYSVTGSEIRLTYGSASNDTNFDRYRIFYKQGSSGVAASDSEHSDANLLYADYNSATSTLVSGLMPNRQYVFNIWAYDSYGNLASSTEVSTTTPDLEVPPVVFYNSAEQRRDGTKRADISMNVDDSNFDDVRVKVEYEAGTDCLFMSSVKTSLDESSGSISSTYGTVAISNSADYQVGAPGGRIRTDSGANEVDFVWLVNSDLPNTYGTYCVRLTGNDGYEDQLAPATTTIEVDTLNPAAPGALSVATTTDRSVTIAFGAPSSDDTFTEYRIYYKLGFSGVRESDTVWNSTSDANMAYIDFNSATTTTITGLDSRSPYVFNIWAYDAFGNKASSSLEVRATTKEPRPIRARTVRFLAGTYTGNGTTGLNSDTNQTLPAFNFQLAEKNPTIRDAYIILEAQFESYANNVGDYTGYSLAFDSCSEPCTANAFTGSGRILASDSTVLAYDEEESNQVRLLLDVTEEAQLAAYSGNSGNLRGQIGYRFNRGTAANSISYASAMLVITYEYDEDLSENYTNTVIYPLESSVAGDSGTRRSVLSTNSCTLNSDCPLFNYNMEIPEESSKLSDWFQTNMVIYDNNPNRTQDVSVDVNIQTFDVNSYTFVHENANAGTQGTTPAMHFGSVYGFAANTAQVLEYHPVSGNNTYYLIGGEAVQTYTASKSASVKTRTVSFPIGVINNGNSTALSSKAVSVHFPENGISSGNVTIKKAWIRLKTSNAASVSSTVTVSTKTGDNAQSGNWIYAYYPGGTIIKPTFDIYHIIPSADYAELALANNSIGKDVTVNVTNGALTQGGVSAELMITYAYTDESNGYLASLDLFAGQSNANGNARLATSAVSSLVVPEITGTKTMLAGGLLASYLFSDSTGVMPGANFLMDANISAGNPSCTNAFITGDDGANAFAELYKDVAASLEASDELSYTACYSNNGGGKASSGGKMNGFLRYTYQYVSPPPEITQDRWRWYENNGAVQPVSAKAGESASINGIQLSDILRLRVNAGVAIDNLSAGSKIFKLQYGLGADCASLPSWTDVGAIGGAQAWIGYDNPVPDDGTSTGSILLSNSNVFQSYEEENPSVTNPRGISIGEYGEWDWVLMNNGATASSDYCFRMIENDGTEFSAYNSYARLSTAPANTKPSDPASLGQYLDSGTAIANSAWINESTVKLQAQAADVNINEVLTLYFELIPSTSNFTDSTSVPAGACASGTDYGSCPGRIWMIASASGDYRTVPFIGTTTIGGLPDAADGYKWQALACDDDGACSEWSNFAAAPNFRVDTTPPDAPGALTLAAGTPTSITLNPGSAAIEDNFSHYRVYYKAGSSGVSESDLQHNDPNFSYIDYNGATSTLITSLSAGVQYVFNIWAYDLAGNKASATPELSAWTTSSFTPPTGSIFSASQSTNGSGAINMIIQVADPDNDDTVRAKIDYVAGSDCGLMETNKPTLDENEETISASYGSPKIDNSSKYQVGTTTGWIITSQGTNYVFFDWLSKEDIPGANSTYCVRLVVNDGIFDQVSTSTRLILIDNVPPTVPGALTEEEKNSTSATLRFGSGSIDTRFDRYRVFYSTSTPVAVSDHEHSDSNLLSDTFNGAATTSVSGLLPDTVYYFNIWAYDQRGNRSSSTQILQIKTNALPYNVNAIGQYKDDEMTEITNGGWNDGSTTKLTASGMDADISEHLTLYFEFIANSDTFTAAASEPVNACVYGTAFGDCASKIWFAASTTPGNWSVDPYTATTSITAIPDSANGYKWQVLACDSYGECASSWTLFNAVTPNLKVDTIAPTAPGPLSENSKTTRSIMLNFGIASTEENFSEYIIYYSSSAPLTESSTRHGSSTDANLASRTYGGAATTTLSGLEPDTDYYINIWAYDLAGNKASSTEIIVRTNAVASTPGVIFYTKNTRSLFYRVWTGREWGSEQTGPTLGSAAGDNIRQIRTIRSDDGSRVAVFLKTWDGTNQEWWATVYRVAANDFVNSTQLGTAHASAVNNGLITGCLAALSGEEFFIVRNNNGANGSLIYSWNAADGWVSEGSGPNPGAVLNGCSLVRRPNTDNYILMTFDQAADVGSAYYLGGATYTDNWTVWTEHSTVELSTSNYVGEAFFDPSDNTRGGINFRNAATGAYTVARKFVCNNTSITYGTQTASPSDWTGNWVHGEFAVDPATVGGAYFIGNDVNGAINVLKVDISGANPAWSASTNGTNISSGGAYSYTNNAQKPYDMIFYKDDKGVAIWNSSSASAPNYRAITASTNTLSAANSSVPGAGSATWSRVRTYKDPNEDEFIAVFQNTANNYAAVFWDGLNDGFHSEGNQAWNQLVTSSGAFSANDECTSFSYTAGNATPSAPGNLGQYRVEGSAIANQGWNNGSSTLFTFSARDADTSEILRVYLELVANNDSFVSTTSVPASACASTTPFDICTSKTWLIASSTLGDYSANAFIATATISSIPDSSVGYKWQVKTCDLEGACSSWIRFNTTGPNFKVDTTPPTPPGALTIGQATSHSVTLNFGAQTVDSNFSRYRIFYKQAASGVVESDSEHIDADLNFINYNGTSNTVVINLASSTSYVFNIWAYDQAGNKASAWPEIATTTSAGAFLSQVSYRFENDDGSDVNNNTAAAAIATPLNNIYKGERLTARIQVENTGGDAANSKVYKLQFENQTDNPGVWTDVGAAAAISFESGLAGSNGAIISSSKAAINSRVWMNGTWHEDTGQTAAFTLVNGYYTEFAFMIHTANALSGKTYRLRLYNSSDSAPLGSYSSYPTLSIAAAESIKYSKGTFAALPANYSDLAYYLDPVGYSGVSAEDGIYDSLQSSANIPIYNFAVKHSNSSDKINASWTGTSTVSAAANPIFLQVYRFGSVNAWQTIASTSASSANLNLAGEINSLLSQYYLSDWTYWRVYQLSGSQILSTDVIDIDFSAPMPYVSQSHYRWRDDDGDESSATWLEGEDTGLPTESDAFNIGENIRLRLSFDNTGGGTASNYAYRLQYATTTGDCSEDPGGWETIIPFDGSKHWTMGTSTLFNNGDPTVSRLSADGKTFVAGSMVANPSATSAPVSLLEGRYTEVEFLIKSTENAVSAGTYCFRALNDASELDNYVRYPVLTLSGVLNTAPYFTVQPSDHGSASSSPTNYGEEVYFSATAADYEGDAYYLAICKTNRVTAGNDGPPVCNGGSWCVSDLTATNTQATCSYTAVDSAEELDWHAFVCDKYPGFGVGRCSASSQGAADTANGSPFSINHPPVLTSVSTTDNNKDPGGTFTITTVSYDNDAAYISDTLTLFVCRTNFATIAGCEAGQEVCSAIAASSPNASCQFTDAAPTPHGNYAYYAFIFDNHNLASAGNSKTNTYTINNTAPVLGPLILNSGNNITLNMRPATTSVSAINASVVDLNGCDTLVSATAVIYMSNAVFGHNCAANDNDCYRIGTSNCVQTACVGSTAAYTCTASFKHFAIPTDNSAGNPYSAYNWLSYINVYDGSNYTATSSSGVELNTTLALSLNEDLIDFGNELYIGDNTGSVNSTTTVVNAGNSPVNTNLSGTDMYGNPSGTLSVSNMKYNLSNFNWISDGTVLSSVPATVDLNAPRPTSDTAVQERIYWGIGIPLTAHPSVYFGNNTFQVIIDSASWN